MLLGKAMFEVKRPGINKGESMRELMAHAPFSGRMPVFIGDDVTDESVFEVLPEIGGTGFRSPAISRASPGVFKDPAQVRSALEFAGRKRAGPRMTDYGLDLAVIGNGRTAALLEPSSRIVWWCLPRYDGDPVFCRLLAGGEERASPTSCSTVRSRSAPTTCATPRSW